MPIDPEQATKLAAFAQDVSEALTAGKTYRVDGLGAFTTCIRKASADRAACKMAMFRASPELRDHVAGGAAPSAVGPHADAINFLIDVYGRGSDVEIPLLGRFAALEKGTKKPRLIFHAATELNDALSG